MEVGKVRAVEVRGVVCEGFGGVVREGWRVLVEMRDGDEKKGGKREAMRFTKVWRWGVVGTGGVCQLGEKRRGSV